MPMMTGGEAVVKALVAEGVEVVFGLPGVQIMHIYDGFYDNPDIRVITCRHEQTTAYMADGYARSTGKIGVALVVPGPGAYNAAAAMSDAYATSSQVLLISGQINTKEIGKDHGALHEISDQLEFMKPVVKWNDLVTRVEDVPETIHEAMRQLKTGRPRPVEIEIPPDVLATTADLEMVEPEIFTRPEPDPSAIRAAADLLASAKRPLIWSGGGVNLSDASRELIEVAEMLGAPVISTAEGKGSIPESHPLAIGTTSYEWGPGTDLYPQADVILAVGSRLGNYRPEPGTTPTAEQKLVNLNIDETEMGKTMPVAVGVVADAKVGLKHLGTALRQRSVQSRWDKSDLARTKVTLVERMKSLAPKQVAVVEGIREAIPDDGFLVGGITNIGAWTHLAYPALKPRTFIGSSYMGNLGFGFPTALGVKVGNPDRAVVALCGDGGFMYAVADLATAVQYGINLVTVVFNNHGYGASFRDQHRRFGDRLVGTELHNPNFVKLAESFGARGIQVPQLEDTPEAIRDAIAGGRPTVIEVELPAELDPPYYLQPPRD
jgi:acetolactate synthase-1/2/3 large subunit